MITFDGPNQVIQLDTTTTSYTAAEIYSRWKDWVRDGNGGYLEAFTSFGGDPIGGGQNAPAFFFLRNDLGWTIGRPESNIEVNILGNLVRADLGQDMFSGPVGAFNPIVNVTLSQVSTFSAAELWNVLLSDFSGDSTVGAALALVFKILRNRAVTDEATGKLIIYDDDDTTALLEANVFEDAAGTVAYRKQGIERRNRLTTP